MKETSERAELHVNESVGKFRPLTALFYEMNVIINFLSTPTSVILSIVASQPRILHTKLSFRTTYLTGSVTFKKALTQVLKYLSIIVYN